MPHRSPPLCLRALLATTVAIGLVPLLGATAAVAAEAPEADRPQVVADAELGPERREAPPASVRGAVTAAAAKSAPRTPAPIATVEGVELLDVSTQTLAIGFHEGATRSLTLSPRFDVPKGTPEPVVMASRNRGTGPTTAIDIAVPADTPVTAPVSGEVVEANAYGLYGSTQDFLVTIAPEQAPHLRVRLFHLDGPEVAVGDTVVGGKTVIAERSRVLPFSSQIDRLTGARAPHVHVQADNS